MLLDNLRSTVDALQNKRKEYRKNPIFGERIEIFRTGKDAIDCIVYCPCPANNNASLPLLIEVHGGAWFGGDATFMDTFCRKMADAVPCVVVNLNYQKLDVHPFPYQQEEVCDVIDHFVHHSKVYSINPNQIVICGQSAGAHICSGAAIMAKDRGLPLAHQILVYPFIDFTGTIPSANEGNQGLEDLLKKHFFAIDHSHPYVSALSASKEVLHGISPATIVVCGLDELRPHGVQYQKKLVDSGVPAVLREYPEAIHGFLEVNRPDFVADHPAKNKEQSLFCAQLEEEIVQLLKEVR